MFLDVCLQVEDLLQRGGGKKDPYLSEMITHVIVEDVTEDDYQEAKELFELPVVSVSLSREACYPRSTFSFFLQSQWVVMSVKCKALLPYPLHVRCKHDGSNFNYFINLS